MVLVKLSFGYRKSYKVVELLEVDDLQLVTNSWTCMYEWYSHVWIKNETWGVSQEIRFIHVREIAMLKQ